MNRQKFHSFNLVAIAAVCATLVGCAIQPPYKSYAEMTRERLGLSADQPVTRSPAQAQYQRQVRACKAAMWARPTQTGNFGESLGNVAQCDVDPEAALSPPPPTNPPAQPEGGGGISGTAFYRSESTSGFNKICYYDRLENTVAITIPVMQECP